VAGVENMKKTIDRNPKRKGQSIGQLQAEITSLSEEVKQLKAALKENQDISDNKQHDTKQEQEIVKAANEQNNVEEMKARYIAAKKEAIYLKETLYQAYEDEETLLKAYNKLLKQYKSLSESKLGKLTLAYWRRRKGFRGK
jgi:chromosome segregation ATPase